VRTEPSVVFAFCRYLRLGSQANEHSPNKAADLIEALDQERTSAAARIRELENVCLPSIQQAERNAYARGFRAGAIAAAQMETDPVTADAIAALQPNFALAGESA
jgi:hypothetical protein